jgi:hypothetical protein
MSRGRAGFFSPGNKLLPEFTGYGMDAPGSWWFHIKKQSRSRSS